MKLNPEKLAEQQQIIEKWKEAGGRGSVVAVTGFGKTTVALLVIQSMNERHPDRTTHVVVPTFALKLQWETEIKKWKLSNVKVFIINTYIKQSRKAVLLVLDEIHRYGSDVFGRVFSVTKYNFILGLTATIERQDGNHELIERFAPIISTITLKHALDSNYVSDFIVFNLGVQLSDSDKRIYSNINKRFNYNFTFFNHDFDSAMRALQDPNYRKALSSSLDVPAQDIHVKAINFVRAMKERKQFLYEAETKLDAVGDIYDKIDKRMLVFCETTDFADKVTETIGKEAFSYHTKSPDKKQMKENLKLFKENKKFRVVSAVRAIEEGLDVENLECVVLVSGNSTKRQYIQRIGRSLRTYKDKVAIIINIYIHGTQDETWLRKRQSSNRINILWVNDVEQIKGYINSYLNKPAGSVQHDNLGDEHPQGTETPLYTL